MTTIKIEKDVPIHGGGNAGNRNPEKYPFREMEVGDSFFIAENPKAVQSSAYVAGKRLGRRFITRREGDGVRVWRVS